MQLYAHGDRRGKSTGRRSATTARRRGRCTASCPRGRVEPLASCVEIGQGLTLRLEVTGNLGSPQALEGISDVGDGLAHVLVGSAGACRWWRGTLIGSPGLLVR